MTTTEEAVAACRFLRSLWPAPAEFALLAADGQALAGDAALAASARAALAGLSPLSRTGRSGPLVLARGDSGLVAAAHVPRAALPGLLEADLLQVTSGRR